MNPYEKLRAAWNEVLDMIAKALRLYNILGWLEARLEKYFG